MDDAPRGKLAAGDPAIVPLEDWNRVRAEMLRLLGLGAAAPLVWSWEGGRRSLRDTTPVGMWAKLGTESPAGTYAATEQVRSGGAWVDGPRAITLAREVNGGTGLAGTVQFVEPSTAPGEWLFQAVKLGGAAQCGTITFTVKGCGTLNLSGATVTVYDGNASTFPVLATGTTNSSGVYVQSIAAAKTYYYEVSKARFVTSTGTITALCAGSSSNSVNLTLATATGYRCNTACPDPLPATLTVTDPILGTFNLVSANPSTNHSGCLATPAIAGVRTATFCTASGSNLAVPVRVSLVGSGGIAQLQIDIKACDHLTSGGSMPEGAAQAGSCPVTGSADVDYKSYSVTLTGVTCIPFSASGTRSFALSGGNPTPGTTVYGNGVSRTWVISE